MEALAFRKDKTVHAVEESGILGDTLFHSDMLDLNALYWRKRPAAREAWHAQALLALEGAELVFADPDNGLTTTVKPTQKDSQKFVLSHEVVDYFERGQDVVYYQHRTRHNAEGWLTYKRVMREHLINARLLAVTFHKWSARTYVFVVHENAYDRYERLLKGFLTTGWGTMRIGKSTAFIAEEI